ncbi:DUF4278 domain-containing protein [Myxosarcina sp. GI1(2024)]
MKANEERRIKISFPFSLYFQQLVCPNTYVKSLNPFSFWRRYRNRYLETCWEINLVRYLERCLKIEWQPVQQEREQDIELIRSFTKTGVYRGLPWKKTPQNTILIAQPSFELKYRGVTYRISGIMAINGNKLPIKPSQVSRDSLPITPSYNQNNNSETSSKML